MAEELGSGPQVQLDAAYCTEGCKITEFTFNTLVFIKVEIIVACDSLPV